VVLCAQDSVSPPGLWRLVGAGDELLVCVSAGHKSHNIPSGELRVCRLLSGQSVTIHISSGLLISCAATGIAVSEALWVWYDQFSGHFPGAESKISVATLTCIAFSERLASATADRALQWCCVRRTVHRCLVCGGWWVLAADCWCASRRDINLTIFRVASCGSVDHSAVSLWPSASRLRLLISCAATGVVVSVALCVWFDQFSGHFPGAESKISLFALTCTAFSQ
jgi:hypothetical protein